MCLQSFKVDTSHEITLQNNEMKPGTLCIYTDDFGKPVSVITVVRVHVRRGNDGGVREGWICQSEKGYLFTAPDFDLVPKYARAGQKTHGLRTFANGARANLYLAGVTNMTRRKAKKAFIKFHWNNFTQDIRAMHSTQLCPMRLCSETGGRIKWRSKLGEVFEEFNKAWAEGMRLGLCPLAHLDNRKRPNLLWGFLAKDNNKQTAFPVPGLKPFGEEDNSDDESGDEEGDESGDEGFGCTRSSRRSWRPWGW